MLFCFSPAARVADSNIFRGATELERTRLPFFFWGFNFQPYSGQKWMNWVSLCLFSRGPCSLAASTWQSAREKLRMGKRRRSGLEDTREVWAAQVWGSSSGEFAQVRGAERGAPGWRSAGASGSGWRGARRPRCDGDAAAFRDPVNLWRSAFIAQYFAAPDQLSALSSRTVRVSRGAC